MAVAVTVAVTVAVGVAVTVAPGVDVAVKVKLGVGVGGVNVATTLAIDSLDAAGTAIEPDENVTWRPGRSAPPCLR